MTRPNKNIESMIPGAINDVDKDALRGLVMNQVREGKTIEYKREMPGGAKSDFVPLLATVSSLANTAGGDLLLGVEAIDGVPTGLPGIVVDNLDREILRLEHLLLNGVEPRIPHVDIHPIAVADDKYVLVIRVPSSWIAPHRVNRNSKFYARNSAGRYELDVGELRTAFTLSESIAVRIRDFRTDRIARIHSRETPVPLDPGGCMAVHALPLGSFMATTAVDIAVYESSSIYLPPLGASGFDRRINLDGVVNFSGAHDSSSRAYTQVFRSGVVESVAVLRTHDDRMLLPSVAYEQDVVKFLTSFLRFAGEFEIEPPYYVFLSLVGVRGCEFAVRAGTVWPDDVNQLREDMLILPEVVVQDRDEKPDQLLRPVFDMVWNAFGFMRSFNYDDQNNWVGR